MINHVIYIHTSDQIDSLSTHRHHSINNRLYQPINPPTRITLLHTLAATFVTTISTGSGKTLAFALPALQSLLTQEDEGYVRMPRRPRCVILVPTRELARQVSHILHHIILYHTTAQHSTPHLFTSHIYAHCFNPPPSPLHSSPPPPLLFRFWRPSRVSLTNPNP